MSRNADKANLRDPVLVGRAEAARLSTLSPRGFDQIVRPRLHEFRLGRRVMFSQKELLECLLGKNADTDLKETAELISGSAASGIKAARGALDAHARS